MSAIIRLNRALRVSIPDLTKEIRASCYIGKPRSNPIVTREVKVDDRIGGPRVDPLSFRRRGLQELGRQRARFGQQEQTDLRDVRTGGDVHQIVFVFRIKRIATREIVQDTVETSSKSHEYAEVQQHRSQLGFLVET